MFSFSSTFCMLWRLSSCCLISFPGFLCVYSLYFCDLGVMVSISFHFLFHFSFLFLRADCSLGRISSLAYYLCHLLIFVWYCFFVYYMNAVLSPVIWWASKGCLQGKGVLVLMFKFGLAHLKSPAPVDLLSPDFPVEVASLQTQLLVEWESLWCQETSVKCRAPQIRRQSILPCFRFSSGVIFVSEDYFTFPLSVQTFYISLCYLSQNVPYM